jgi:hypothetical protein
VPCEAHAGTESGHGVGLVAIHPSGEVQTKTNVVGRFRQRAFQNFIVLVVVRS